MNAKGMMVSTSGLGLHGEQVVAVSFTALRKMLFVLDGGVVNAYDFDPSSTYGFSPSAIGNRIIAEIESKKNPDWNIVEIAGGATLKVRFDSGYAYEVDYYLYGDKVSFVDHEDIARVTDDGFYEFKHRYYMHNNRLVPLIGNDIVSIDGKASYKLDDLYIDYPVSFEGGTIRMNVRTGALTLVSDDGNTTNIDAVVNIARDIDATRDIVFFIVSQSQPPVPNIFPGDHYQYIDANKKTWKLQWAGYGDTGHVVDSGGDTYVIKVDVPVKSEAIRDKVSVVISNGTVYDKYENGTLHEAPAITLNGIDLVDFIYHHRMSEYVVLQNQCSAYEPFNVNGYYFGYMGQRWVDATL